MQLVILAAGHGRRFGGLKQLAPVGPHGEAIMDYTAVVARACGFTEMVLVVREEIRTEMADHVHSIWPEDLPVTILCQPPVPGTAQAVLAAKAAIDGPFGVVNADDLYGDEALGQLINHFKHPSPTGAGRHVAVAFELARTVLNDKPLTRGLCQVLPDGRLGSIVEHTVALRHDGRFEGRPLPSNQPHSHSTLDEVAAKTLTGDEPTSMNLWGFHPRILDHLEEALESFDASTAARPELLLPDVVNDLVLRGIEQVHVTTTSARCIGITHPDDLRVVQDELAFLPNMTAARGVPVR